MDNKGKSIANFNLQSRVNELNDIALLKNEFSTLSYKAVERYYYGCGYQAGFDRFIALLKEDKISRIEVLQNPLKAIRDFLHGYFVERGGNLPEVWIEDNTVYLKTEITKYCVTIEAEKTAEKSHPDICAIYCRSFAKGLLSIFPELFSEIQINFYNKSTQRDGKGSDCVEAFQVIIG